MSKKKAILLGCLTCFFLIRNVGLHNFLNQKGVDFDNQDFYSSTDVSSLRSMKFGGGNGRVVGVLDMLCTGCRLVLIQNYSRLVQRKNNGRPAKKIYSKLTCGELILKILSKKKNKNKKTKGFFSSPLVFQEAAQQVAQMYPESCHRCDPSSCNDAQKYYWRPDEPFGGNHLFQAITPQLRRIPSKHRLPHHLTHSNFSDYFTKRQGLYSSLDKTPPRIYWEYNPSIAILPKDQIPHHSNLDRNQSYYIMVVRLSDHSSCYTPQQKILLNQEWTRDLLGLAILDHSLNIVSESIVKHQLFFDHRVFNLNGQLYLGYNNRLRALWLNRPTAALINLTETTTTTKKYNNNNKTKKPFRKLWPAFNKRKRKREQQQQQQQQQPSPSSQPLLVENNFPVFIGRKTRCCITGHCQGKNYNYFVNHQGTVLVETYPSNPHMVEVVDTAQKCKHSGSWDYFTIDAAFLHKYYPQTTSQTNNNNSTFYITHDVPRESFGTVDEIHFADHGVFALPYTEERGTACCVKIRDPRRMIRNEPSSPATPRNEEDDEKEKELYVGISHTKIPMTAKTLMKENPGLDFDIVQYTSQLYAFESVPPYRLVARSGRFCLGPSQDEEEQEQQQKEQNHNFVHLWVQQFPYRLNRTNYNCPKITFVSALSESVDDPSEVILGYGMNDCAMRIAKVKKERLVYLLFMDHQETFDL